MRSHPLLWRALRHAGLLTNRHQELEISDPFDQSALLGLSVALGVGLLIGAERERRKHAGPNRAAAGIRTFSVVALLGAVSVMFGGTLVMAVAALMVGAGALLVYQKTRQQDPGMTTQFALLLTCLLGGLAMHSPFVAAGLGTVLAGLYGLALVVMSGGGAPPERESGQAFDLKMAAGFAVLVSAVVVLSAALNAWWGSDGLLLSAAVAGLVDAHATAASAASLMGAQKITSAQAVVPILVGLSTNTLMKAMVAFNAGGIGYAKRVVPGLALMILAVWLGACLG